jgi:hypothetical protein
VAISRLGPGLMRNSRKPARSCSHERTELAAERSHPGGVEEAGPPASVVWAAHRCQRVRYAPAMAGFQFAKLTYRHAIRLPERPADPISWACLAAYSSPAFPPSARPCQPAPIDVYLHYVLDLWFERVVKGRLRGEARLVRYIDDFVICFQYRSDAIRVQDALRLRLGKFGLTLAVC